MIRDLSPVGAKIALTQPPKEVWDQCIKQFEFDHDSTVFTYADIIYNPGGVLIPDDIIVHEKTHMRQQGFDETIAKLWWQKYFLDPEFRIAQEIEAYGNQYRYICQVVRDRNRRARALNDIASFLSGPMYGRAISFSKAIIEVRENAGQ